MYREFDAIKEHIDVFCLFKINDKFEQAKSGRVVLKRREKRGWWNKHVNY